MKLTYEDKVEMYRLWKEDHYSSIRLATLFKCDRISVTYIVKLIDIHGISVVQKKKNREYSAEFKEEAIRRVLIQHESIKQVSLSLAIPSKSTLSLWIKSYIKNGYNVIEKKRGRYGQKESAEDRIRSRITETDTETSEAKHEAFDRERILKKIKCLSSGKNCPREWERVTIINELRRKYKLTDLLAIDGMPRSTFYFYLKKMKQPDKYLELKEIIKQIFHENKGRYGYRRITMELHNRGYHINHKTVRKLMNQCCLKCEIRRRKYRSYKGEVGKVAPNELKRNFQADKPNQKWCTDVTEFSVQDKKIYLSPILDLYNGEIISYNLSLHPNFHQIMDMLEKAFEKIPNDTKLILHSDQGWQYQMKRYQARLKEKGVIQSMSRKGNCLDNSVMENFFGLLKTEMYYKHSFSSAEQLMREIEDYIDYYNNKRIKCKLKGLSPVQYRIQSQRAA